MVHICANCGIPVTWQATEIDGQYYCCLGCAGGGPCTCDYSSLPDPGGQRGMVCVSDVRLMTVGVQPDGSLNVEVLTNRRFRSSGSNGRRD